MTLQRFSTTIKNFRFVSLTLTMLMLFGFLLATQSGYALDPKLSGQRSLGHNILESAYNTTNGQLVFLRTPEGDGDNDHDDIHEATSVAPLYIVVYPSSVAGVIGTVNCQHQPEDNCPDHGPVFAGLAESTVPSVYENGVWGHDHIGPFPPLSRREHGNKLIFWVPVAVLFNTLQAASTHITTIDQLHAAEKANQVTEIVLWDAAFAASQTTQNVYLKGTPVTPAPPTP